MDIWHKNTVIEEIQAFVIHFDCQLPDRPVLPSKFLNASSTNTFPIYSISGQGQFNQLCIFWAFKCDYRYITIEHTSRTGKILNQVAHEQQMSLYKVHHDHITTHDYY